MGVYLREKKLGSGQISYYLDIYHNKARWYEFLEIRASKTHPSEQDKEKKRLAQEIRAKRENELIVLGNGLIDKNKRKANFVSWFENYIQEKKHNGHNKAALVKLKKYLGKRPLPFSAITSEWIKGFTKFLLEEISNNSARCYLMDIFAGLEDAVRQDIIPKNPFRQIERSERIKQKDVFRQSLTLEQLQLLAQTPCDIHPQIKQAYLFSCFSGLRWSDVNPLQWKEIITKKIEGREEHFIYFEQEKTEGIEYLPLSDIAVEIIKQRKREMAAENIQSPYVFPLVKEYDEKNELMHKKVNRALKKWAEAAEINQTITFHTARHSFATNVLEHSPDADLWTVSKLLGHKNIHSTQIYAHVRDRKKYAAVKSLPSINLKSVHLKVA